MGMLLFWHAPAATAYGVVSLPITFGAVTRGNRAAGVSFSVTFGVRTGGVVPLEAATSLLPTPDFEVAFASAPLTAAPAWDDLSTRLRSLSVQRGRSYEFDRMETGTLGSVLGNRDAALNPENTASPYTPLKSTRPVRAKLVWGSTTYPLFRGSSEGYPQAYRSLGLDAFVSLQASDLFYALNNARFPQGQTFAEEMSGTRIQNVLDAVGFAPRRLSGWYDLDAGQTLITASGDLTDTNPLEHINLVVDAELGRFFVSREGKFTFRDRHSVYLDYLTPAMTFADDATGSEVPYLIEGALQHSEEKLYNHVRITTPSGYVAEVEDATSISDHFRRSFEREWPYALSNDADSAALFLLARNKEHALRLPELVVHGAKNPSVLWPLLLAREIGDRCTFRYQPEGGGDEIVQDVVIEGIGHQVEPDRHVMRFQLTEVDPNEYWIVGTTGYSELGETTWAAF